MNSSLQLVFNAVKVLAVELNEDEIWLQSQVISDIGDEPTNEIAFSYIKTVVEKKKLGWDHSSFDLFKQKQREQDDYVLNPFQAEEGVVECKKCGSLKVFSVAMQTRAADEPMTTVSYCTLCKNTWSQNG